MTLSSCPVGNNYIHQDLHAKYTIFLCGYVDTRFGMRMDDKRTPKGIFERKSTGMRIRGRPRKRWIEGTEEDLQIM
jgi:hypothetical protein